MAKKNRVTANRHRVTASARPRRANRRIMAASINRYEELLAKIQYYAKKIIKDVRAAEKVFGRQQFVNISVPDVSGDELFYEWYVSDYVDLFDENHNGGEIIEVRSRREIEYNVAYGIFNGEDLEDNGTDSEALFDIIVNSSYMEDLYYVTVEYGYTIEDIANDPHKVFDNLEGDAEYYAEEVLAELDLWTQSDRSYDFEKSARGIVKLYNEVEDYFSYDNAERLLKEYREDMGDEY